MAFTLDMVGLTVKDMQASLAFYRTLGVEVPAAEPDEMYVEATLPNGLRLSWNDVRMIREIDPHYVEPVGQRLGIAFLCDSPEDVDARFARIVAAGYAAAKEPWDAFWGQRYAIVLDPDGLAIDLFCPLAS